jgi:hypothetical protein
MRRRLGRIAAAMLLVLSASSVGAGTALAADPVTFGTPKASSAFGKSIEFEQPVVLAAAPRRVELLLRTPGAVGPTVTEIPAPSTGDQTLRYQVDLTTGHVVPNTTFVARWRVTDADGRAWLGPATTHTYADDRITWKTLNGDVVRVHWYEGSDAFGRRALAIGDKAVADTSAILGVTETEPIGTSSTARWVPAPVRTSAARRIRTSGRCSPSSPRARSMPRGSTSSCRTS